jgi:hypothetical protein
MQLTRRNFLGGALVATAGLAVSSCVAGLQVATSLPQPVPPPVPVPTPEAVAAAQVEGPPLFAEAIEAMQRHAAYLTHTDRIGLVNFSVASREPRFQIVDVATGEVQGTWLVAHGSGSDPRATGMLQRFSNEPGSNATSRGAFLTADMYQGKHGSSRRLVGLDAENNMALDRAIVIHGAAYVHPSLIASQGRIGRSQGCFAFEQAEVGKVMELLGEGRMIYAGQTA